MSKVHSPTGVDWQGTRDFHFTLNGLLGLGEFMQKAQFRNASVPDLKTTVDVEKDRRRSRLKKK